MEQTVASDLKLARLVVHKLNQTFDSFQSHAFSIASLSHQWQNLQTSFAKVDATLSNRVKELDSKDRVLVATALRIENLHKEVVLKERSLVERSKEVELREKEINEFYEGVEVEKKRIRSHCEALKAKEKKIFEGLSRVRVIEEELKRKEVELDARFRDLELRENVLMERVVDERREVFLGLESDLRDRLEELKVRGDEMIVRFDVRCKEMEDEHDHKKAVIDERLKDLELKEMELGEVLALKEKEKEMDEVVEQLELRRKELEVEEEERRAVIEQLELRRKELEVEEEERRAVIEQLELRRQGLEVEEEDRKVLIDKLELQRKELEVEEEERKVVIEQLESRRKSLEAEEKDRKTVIERLELRRKELEGGEEEKKAVIEQLELRRKELEVEEEARKVVIKQLVSRRKDLEVEEEKKKAVIEQLESRRKELELEEEEKKAVIDALALKEDQMEENYKVLEAKGVKISECLKLLGSEEKVKRVNLREMELKERKMKEQWNEFETKKKKMKESLRDLELREKKLKDDMQALECKEKQLDEYQKEMELKEKEMKECGKAIEKKEKQIIRRGKVQELIAKDLELSKEENDQLRRRLEVREEEDKKLGGALELKEKEIDDLRHSLELMRNRIGHCESLELKEREINERSRLLELREEEENQRRQALELKEKGVSMRIQHLEPTVNQIEKFCMEEEVKELNMKTKAQELKEKRNNECYIQVCSLCIDMNANGLRSYLNNHVKEHNALRDDILSALRCASDPSKLVLNVCRDFHETNLTKRARNNNKSSCIYVLELLTMLNPNITPSMKEEARNFADFWMRRSKRHASSPADAFGFLQFLAAYKLAGLYKVEDMLLHLTKLYSVENLYLPEKHVKLCNVLGISDSIPDCIKSLIESKKRLDAIKFICVFKMEDSFPLKPLLKGHVDFIIQTAKERRRTKNLRAKVMASNKEYNGLVAVLKCISEFKLPSKFKLRLLKQRIQQLQKEREIKNNASKSTQKKNAESHITPVIEMAESNNCIEASSVAIPLTDVVTKSETWKKRNASSALSITSPELPEKRPRVQIPNQPAPRAPWPNHGPRTYEHPPQLKLDVCWTGPHGPFLPSNGSHPHFAVPNDNFVVRPHPSTNQFVAPIPYPVDPLAHLGRERAWEQPNMH